MQRRQALCLLAAAPFAAATGQSIEVIELRFRTADQVLPVLQPLVEPGGALSGQGSQLFLRTSRANAAQIRQVLATLDLGSLAFEGSDSLDDPEAVFQ